MVLATVRVCQHSLCTSPQHAEPGCDFHRGIVGCAVGFSGFHFFTNMPVLARCKPTITVVSQNGCLFIASLLLTKGLSADVGIWRRPVANVMKCLLLTTCHRRNIGFFWCEAVTWFLCVLGFSPHTWSLSRLALLETQRKVSGWRCLTTSYQWNIDAFGEPHRTLTGKRHLTGFRRPPYNIGCSSAEDWIHIFSEILLKPRSLWILSSTTASEEELYERGLCCYWACCACLESCWTIVCKQKRTTTSTKSV